MEDYFSEYQRELHLPNPSNPDMFSPENCIISKFTPSVYRYGWYSRHFLEIEASSEENMVDGTIFHTYHIPRKFFSLVDIKISGDYTNATLYFGESKGNGNNREYKVLQEFSETLIDYFDNDLPWFFKNERDFIYMTEIPDDQCLKLVVTGKSESPIRVALEYRNVTSSEKFHWTKNAARKTNYCRVWEKLENLQKGEYDSVLSVLIFGDIEGKLTISQGREVFVDCDSSFFVSTFSHGGRAVRFDNYDKRDTVPPGIPSNEKITVAASSAGDYEVYVQVYRFIKF